MRKTMREFKLIGVTKNVKANPKLAEASAKYPEMVADVEDESASFVLDVKTGDYWPANEFFYAPGCPVNNGDSFYVEEGK